LRRLLLWGTTALLVWGFLFAEDGLLSLAVRSWKIRQLQQRIASLQERRDWLLEEIARREADPATLERLAREEYGMIRPGERVVRIRPVDEAEARRYEAHVLQPRPETTTPTP
jgi:cell division protein FtsB